MAKIVASRPFLFAKRDLRIFIFSSLADRVVVVDMVPVKGYFIFSMFDDVDVQLFQGLNVTNVSDPDVLLGLLYCYVSTIFDDEHAGMGVFYANGFCDMRFSSAIVLRKDFC